jgi:hypothetical protein
VSNEEAALRGAVATFGALDLFFAGIFRALPSLPRRFSGPADRPTVKDLTVDFLALLTVW